MSRNTRQSPSIQHPSPLASILSLWRLMSKVRTGAQVVRSTLPLVAGAMVLLLGQLLSGTSSQPSRMVLAKTLALVPLKGRITRSRVGYVGAGGHTAGAN